MERRPKCPDCDTEMESGFVPDLTYGGYDRAHWHRGEALPKKFMGFPAGMAVSAKDMAPIRAMRCTTCGLLRLYSSPGRGK
jgi:hypothetical protein